MKKNNTRQIKLSWSGEGDATSEWLQLSIKLKWEINLGK